MPAPPTVRWMFHPTATVRSFAEATEWLTSVAGLRVIQQDESLDPLVGRRGGCSFLGDNLIELVEPIIPGAAAMRFLERFGPGMHSIALQVTDIDDAAEWFASKGVRVARGPGAAFFFTDPRDTGGVFIEWSDVHGADFDWRYGYVNPPRACEPLVDVQRIASVGALVPDAAATFARLQELWPAPVLFHEPGASPDRPVAGLGTGDCVFELYQAPAADQAAKVWGSLPPQPRVHLLGLRVPDLTAAGRALEGAGVHILRGDPRDGAIVTRPEDTLGMVISWTDRDLPNDPRGPLQS